MNINCQPPLQFVYFSTDTHIPWISHNTLRDRLFKNGVAIRKKVYSTLLYDTFFVKVTQYVDILILLCVSHNKTWRFLLFSWEGCGHQKLRKKHLCFGLLEEDIIHKGFLTSAFAIFPLGTCNKNFKRSKELFYFLLQ